MNICIIYKDLPNVISNNIYIVYLLRPFLVPKFTVLDGFGRILNNQFYEVGSSLEICCQVQTYEIVRNIENNQ